MFEGCMDQKQVIIPYSGKFSMGANFRDFRWPSRFRENLNHENFNWGSSANDVMHDARADIRNDGSLPLLSPRGFAPIP